MSIMQIMDERREAALHERLEDALREHVGSAKRRKKRTRTSCEASSPRRAPRGELPAARHVLSFTGKLDPAFFVRCSPPSPQAGERTETQRLNNKLAAEAR